MNIENQIESHYRDLLECSQIDVEYSDLYKQFKNKDNFIKIIEHIRNIIGDEDKS